MRNLKIGQHVLHRPVFTVKYPSCVVRKPLPKRKVPPEKPPRTSSSKRMAQQSVEDELGAGAAKGSDLELGNGGGGKRIRRAPRRLVEESYSGPDLDKRLKREIRTREAAASRVAAAAFTDAANPVVEAGEYGTAPTAVIRPEPSAVQDSHGPVLQPPLTGFVFIPSFYHTRKIRM